jgi:low molecular weight protein-tyrosine phosphatase
MYGIDRATARLPALVMTSILVVCTGNICRSPMAEGFLRDDLEGRFGADAPTVSSAGTSGLEGQAASAGSVRAAAERGSNIEAHRARRLTHEMLREADLVLCMAGDHRVQVASLVPEVASRSFTLKELVRLLESADDPDPALHGADALADRVAVADALRASGFTGNPRDEDIADPLGMPLESYRAIAWELEGLCARLADGLFGTSSLTATEERQASP